MTMFASPVRKLFSAVFKHDIDCVMIPTSLAATRSVRLSVLSFKLFHERNQGLNTFVWKGVVD